MNDPWRITLLGGLRAQQGEQVITRFKTQKVAALLAYLAYHLPRAHPRELLIELLWPESDAPTLRNSLSVALSTLRSQFEPPGVPQGTVLRADRFSVGLNPATVTTDVARFEQALEAAAKAGSALERAQHMTEAVGLYQGPLLPGFYEEWIPAEQARLAGLFLDALGALVGHLEGIGDTRAALAHARRAVATDPLREEGQQHLIRLLAADGQPGAAQRQFEEYERLLEEETGGIPSPGLRELVRRIEEDPGPSARAPAAPEPVPPRPASSAAPAGGPATVTFLLTDIEGSTRLCRQAPEAYAAARERHHMLLRREFAREGGQEVKETGDGFIAAFSTAASALSCAVAVQQALAEETWPGGIEPLKVRMALHTGDVRPGSEERQYQGIVLHHASRMLTAAHGGQILVSEATAALAPGGGAEGIRLVDLGVYRLPGAAKAAVPEAKRLFQAEYPEMPRREFGPLAAEAGHRANVPPRFTRFFGRDQEMAQLRELLLAPEVRLVTLTGPGGTGKTRLSLEVAERLAEPFAGAAYFAALADLNDPGLIAGAVLDSLRVPRSPQREPLEQAVEALSAKPTLLVLDNFEHLVEDGAGLVEALLTRVSSLKLLVTSRQLLGLSAEREFVLSPLPVPRTVETPEQLTLYESVQLFIDRAQQVIPHFQVSSANAAALAALVGGLEGIPLAIELAAARVQVLTPAQMLAQLARRFDFLATRKRDVAERHRTLRGTVEWSYRLLTPELQRFFARLSVFRGGWSVEAAEAVCAEPLALDCLEQLRECSLVLAVETGAGRCRFRMLETLREYGRERLAEGHGDELPQAAEEACRARHARFFLDLAVRAEPELNGPAQAEWLQRIEEDLDNFRAALEWSLAGTDDGKQHDGAEAQRDEVGLRLGAALGWFWWMRGDLSEGRAWLEALLARSGCEIRALAPGGELRVVRRSRIPEWPGERFRAVALAQVKALSCAGMIADDQSDYETAWAVFNEGLALAREVGDRAGIARALNNLGSQAARALDWQAARALYEESLALWREIGDRWWVASSLTSLGRLALVIEGDCVAARALIGSGLEIQRQLQDRRAIARSLNALGIIASRLGSLDEARTLFEESLSLVRELGTRVVMQETLTVLGMVVRCLGDLEAARSLNEEALAIAREMGNLSGVADSLCELGLLARDRGDEARAVSLWSESLTLARQVGEKDQIANCLEGFASLKGAPDAMRSGRDADRSRRAARLFGAAAALRELAGTPLGATYQPEYERHVAAARAGLEPSEFQACWAEGRAMPLEDAIQLALASLE